MLAFMPGIDGIPAGQKENGDGADHCYRQMPTRYSYNLCAIFKAGR